MQGKLAMGTLPANGAICNTIVSSTLPEAIAAEYNLKYIETLTGFKYIGEQIKLLRRIIHISLYMAWRRALAVW